MIKRIRQALCTHNDTYEEWTDISRVPGLTIDFVQRLRTLWRCNTCGKEIRRFRLNVDG